MPTESGTALPRFAYFLGFAGLLPQVAALAAMLAGGASLHPYAQAIGYAYAALILSFLGGIWWGVAARSATPPAWLWIAAVAPSLVAFASFVWGAAGRAGPAAALATVGIALVATLGVDLRLAKTGAVPGGWLALRVPLSIGLGALTLGIAFA